jgi:hypothetical protein
MIEFSDLEAKAEAYAANLIAKQYVRKKEAKDLLDESFRKLVENRLSKVGLELIDNIYSEFFVIGLKKENEFILEDEQSGEFYSNNLRMSKGAMALLAIVWSLLILPKRERQTSGEQRIPKQIKAFDNIPRPIPKNLESDGIPEDLFRLEFKDLFGKNSKTEFGRNLNELVRLGFLKRRDQKLYEGPLLDTLVDYSEMSENIQHGLLEKLPEMLKTDLVRMEMKESE